MAFHIADNVRETTETTGTGPYVLAGAVTGSRRVQDSGFVDGDYSYFDIRAGTQWAIVKATVNSGSPWSITVTDVIASSASGDPVDFGAGTKTVACVISSDLLNFILSGNNIIPDQSDNTGKFLKTDGSNLSWADPASGGGGRELLTEDRDYYVDVSTGDDDNDGLSDATAFASLQHALDVIANTLDGSGHSVKIKMADGTYNDATVKPMLGVSMLQIVDIYGSTGPSNPATGVIVPVLIINDGSGSIEINCGLNYLYVSSWSGPVNFYGDTIVGVNVSRSDVYIGGGALTITAGSSSFASAYNYSRLIFERSVTLDGTPDFSDGFISSFQSVVTVNCTFSGSATGPRYSVGYNGIIETGGAGATYLPGDTAGVENTGGAYY
jgi:hypothetical protein